MQKRKITTKGNGVNFYGWRNGEVREVVKEGGLYYLAQLDGCNLIKEKQPLQESEFYLAF